MKGLKTIFGALAIASLFAFSANAQENGNRDENGKVVKGSYATNRGRDNWFIGVGAGINTFTTKGLLPTIPGGIAAEGFVGKWFTPSVGARIGYRGFQNSFDVRALLPTAPKGGNKWNQHFVHADVMWNISNAISGYKETRFWDIIPYAEFGVLIDQPAKTQDLEFASGLGFVNDFRLGKHVDLFIDLSCAVARNASFFDALKFKYAFLPTATAGFIFNLGRSNFDRVSSLMPVVVPVPFTTDQYNALKKRVAELEKENAALKAEIEALKNQAPDTVYVGAEGNVASPATLYFDCGSARLSERELAHLDFFIDNVLSKTEKSFTVTGSADKATGSAKRNMQLSQKRADFVKNYIVKKGVAENRLTVKAEGDTNQRFAKNALNRVVVIE
jgi:hypothetical protein